MSINSELDDIARKVASNIEQQIYRDIEWELDDVDFAYHLMHEDWLELQQEIFNKVVEKLKNE